MQPEGLAKLDKRANKQLNRSIMFFLTKLKSLVAYYARKNQIHTHFPIDSIECHPNKSLRKRLLCKVLGNPRS